MWRSSAPRRPASVVPPTRRGRLPRNRSAGSAAAAWGCPPPVGSGGPPALPCQRARARSQDASSAAGSELDPCRASPSKRWAGRAQQRKRFRAQTAQLSRAPRRPQGRRTGAFVVSIRGGQTTMRKVATGPRRSEKRNQYQRLRPLVWARPALTSARETNHTPVLASGFIAYSFCVATAETAAPLRHHARIHQASSSLHAPHSRSQCDRGYSPRSMQRLTYVRPGGGSAPIIQSAGRPRPGSIRPGPWRCRR